MNITQCALAASLTALLISGCSVAPQSDYVVENSVEDEYVYVLDREKMAYIEKASRTSHSNVDTYWVNPPVKRIKRSELEAMRSKQ